MVICRNVVKSFYTAGMLFDVLTMFDELSEDVSCFCLPFLLCISTLTSLLFS